MGLLHWEGRRRGSDLSTHVTNGGHTARWVITSFGEVQPFIRPVSLTPSTFGALSSHGVPVRASTASAPPTPMAMAPRPPALGVCESVPSIIRPGTEKFSSTIWWMMPDPGPQNWIPYFSPQLCKKSKTSWLVAMADLRSTSAPSLPTIRWSQWMDAGTAVEVIPQVMNCKSAI
ncbi:hypothetical protein OGATHE_004443 [Ogataea polymorpha]|uniref:Uncharacterized protein n=1 Tax=Ogataea polymorpha TaxID=460523 RepID=A0A9P8P0A7_9ASCO|nr:hypothetical protein OGATHE_004443 [Ogataea polymorpha]